MLGINYIKAGPTQYVLHYQGGRVRRAGTGLAFFYYQPAASIVVVPVGSADVPFIFKEMAGDFQPLTVQGQLTYRVTNPKLVAELLDYTVAGKVDNYVSEDPDKLHQRVVNLAQVLTRGEVQTRPMRDAILASDEIANAVLAKLSNSEPLAALGVEVITFAILAIKPTPEVSRALEAEARESLLQQADEAIYDRRNSAVEQERRIKENELNTEIAIEEKQRQIRETKVEADLAIEIKQQEIRETELQGQVTLENQRKELVAAHAENARADADAESYAIAASLRPLETVDANVLQMMAMQSAEPRLVIASAIKEIAKNADKIGRLNISPELLDSLIN